MKTTTTRFGVTAAMAMLTLVLAACGGGSSSSGTGSSAGGNNVNGTFVGVWRSDSTNNGEIDGNFRVSGNTVNATVTRHTISACPLTSFRGNWSEASSSLDGTFSGSASTVSWSAKLIGNRLSGPYSVTSGNCAGDTGTITLTRS